MRKVIPTVFDLGIEKDTEPEQVPARELSVGAVVRPVRVTPNRAKG